MGYRIQPNGVYPGITAANVADYINDYTANDHNTLVADVRNFGQQFGSLGYGNGEDGKFMLGSIINPIATNIITLQDGGAGSITGTVQYRYRMYNYSGVTAPTNISASLVVTGKRILATIPGQASGSNTSGYKVERTTDAGSTWFHTADVPVDDVTQPITFTDNNPITSGTNLGASNTTSANGTLPGGAYNFTSFTIASGQTLTLSSSGEMGGIADIRCTGDILIQGTFTASSCFSRSGYPNQQSYTTYNSGIGVYQQTNGTNGSDATQQGVSGYSGNALGINFLKSLYMQGYGGRGYANSTATNQFAGGSVAIVAFGSITVSGTINCNGGNGAVASPNAGGDGGNSGGLIALYSATSLNLSGTLSCNGGNGGNGTSNGSGSGTCIGGFGAGGGFIVLSAPFITDTSTKTVSAGTNGTNSAPSSSNTCGGGGAGVYSGGQTTAGQIFSYNSKRFPRGFLN